LCAALLLPALRCRGVADQPAFCLARPEGYPLGDLVDPSPQRHPFGLQVPFGHAVGVLTGPGDSPRPPRRRRPRQGLLTGSARLGFTLGVKWSFGYSVGQVERGQPAQVSAQGFEHHLVVVIDGPTWSAPVPQTAGRRRTALGPLVGACPDGSRLGPGPGRRPAPDVSSVVEVIRTKNTARH
jgi:hypothetical protein